MKSEYQWLDKVKELLEKDKLDKEDYISWSAHDPSPLLRCYHSDENTHSMAMIQHSINEDNQGRSCIC